MIACGMSARRGNIWVDRYYPTSMCTAAWMSMTAIQVVKIASTTKASIIALTSFNFYRVIVSPFINQSIHALLTPWENYNIFWITCRVKTIIHACNTIGYNI